MASSKPRIYTYHVAPHFNIAANNGALQLGTVVKDLVELAPLNKKAAEPVPDDEIYTSTPQTGFHATRSQLKSGKFGIWAEALGLKGLGGHGSAGAERSNAETFSCDSIVTTYFDPTDEWVSKCLDVKPVRDFIVASGYKKEVYVVTGLKVATNLTFESEGAQSAEAEAKVEASVPQAPVGVGVEGSVNAKKDQTLGFQSTDIVVGFRVKKYRYKKKSLFGNERTLDGKLVTKGAEMLDGTARQLKNLDGFEEVPIEEEVRAQKDAEEQEGPLTECWVR
ncbi:hypothetical protein QBC34DRAFT_416456 [Podospora aff. communis PSN243]|uniref:Uncharacterized protein n=1 Tax=Podospora aff. communis PSN243 TaxID=3040156 RepID=A0AAV9G7R9_9PEZI|nr:hypothetical protein QBC34DRAFT_416456 [Podospora aff. communis PSN243]